MADRKSVMLTNKRIAVVGGGPGGFTLARLLQMNGVDVTVYERDTGRHARPQGATLDLHKESGLKALNAAGLMDAFWANYRPGADRVVIVDRDANIKMEEFSSADLGEGRPEIDRGPLRDLLLGSLEPGTVVWDRQFSSLTHQDDGICLTFANGTTACADIVIGADGANSRIRPYITSAAPVYSGITIIEGWVHDCARSTPDIHKLIGIGKVFALGDGKALMAGSKGDGGLAFYTSHRVPETWARTCGIDFTNNSEVLRWFKGEFEGWAEVWEELYRNADPGFTPRPQYYMPVDQPWDALPNMTLIGDAAHVMPPFAGEGVNMAMLDALELAECLLSDGYADTRAAISAYETRMRERNAEAMEATRENTEMFHAPDGLQRLVALFESFRGE